MRYYYFIKKILTKNEIFKMYFVCFLMVVNSVLEVISIGALLPLLSIMMDNKLNIPFMNQIYIFFDNFNVKLDIYLITTSLLSIYLIKYLFSFYFIKEQAKFILKLKSHLSTRVFDKESLSKQVPAMRCFMETRRSSILMIRLSQIVYKSSNNDILMQIS